MSLADDAFACITGIGAAGDGPGLHQEEARFEDAVRDFIQAAAARLGAPQSAAGRAGGEPTPR